MLDQNQSTLGQPTENDVRMQRNTLAFAGCALFGLFAFGVVVVTAVFGFFFFLASKEPGRDPTPPSPPFLAPNR